MKVELWQVPLLVMAGIILLELLTVRLLSRRADGEDVARQRERHRRWQRGRTVALVLIALLGLGMGIKALGTSLADQLASVAASVGTLAALWLAYLSYLTLQRGAARPETSAAPDQVPAPVNDAPVPQPRPEPEVGIERPG